MPRPGTQQPGSTTAPPRQPAAVTLAVMTWPVPGGMSGNLPAFGRGSADAASGMQRSGAVNQAHNLRKNTWPSRTTMAIPSPTMDDPEMGPKARESQEPERLSPSTKYWFWASVVVAIGLAPTWP